MHGDNPAGRLLSIIESGRNANQDRIARTVWREILEIKSNDNAILLERIGRVMSLPGQIVAQLEANHPRQFSRETHQHMVSCFSTAFSHNIFGTRWALFMAPIDLHTFQFLSSTDELFESKHPASALTSDQLHDLRTRTEDLIVFVLGSGFPQDLKSVLAERLKIVLSAIDTYLIGGAAPILDAVLCSIAHANLSESGKSSMTTQDGKSFIDRLATLANMVTVATGAIGIAQATAPVLAYVTK